MGFGVLGVETSGFGVADSSPDLLRKAAWEVSDATSVEKMASSKVRAVFKV